MDRQEESRSVVRHIRANSSFYSVSPLDRGARFGPPVNLLSFSPALCVDGGQFPPAIVAGRM